MRTIKIVLIFCGVIISSTAFGNKLINDDFELGTVASAWTDSADVSFWTQTGGTAVDNKAHLSDGTWAEETAVSSLVTPSDKAVKWRWGNKGIYQEFAAEPDVETFFSMEVLNDPGAAVTGRNLQIRVSWYDGAGGAISTNTVVAQFDPTVHVATGVWHFVEGSMVAPSTSITGRMELWSQKMSSNTGIFFVDNASVTDVATPPDTTAPSPDPMTFSDAPQTVGATAVWMTASEATDPSGVQYYFTCTSGGGHDSGWQLERTYMDTGLAPETTYTYTVKARDLSVNQNETASSSPPASVTTDAPNASLVNGNFENGTTGQFDIVAIPGWNTWGTSGSHHTEAGRTQDTKAIKISDTDTGVSQDISVVGGYDYRISAMIASFSDSAAINRDGGVQVEWYNGASLIKAEVVGYYIGNLDAYDVWKTVSAVLSAPDGVNMMKLIVVLEDFVDGGSPSGTCYFDNIALTPIGTTLCAKGDLDENCQVDLYDLAILAAGWKDIYGIANLADLAEYWLNCTMFDQTECFLP